MVTAINATFEKILGPTNKIKKSNKQIVNKQLINFNGVVYC